MKALLTGVVVTCLSIGAAAQTVLENNPTFLKWNQVNTPHFRVLFPKGFELQAQRVANTLAHIHEPEARSMGKTPRKISVILQNQTSQSNGFVSYLPRRSEFYTMPVQDYNFLGTNDWLDLLASHEYRHVVQYRQATQPLHNGCGRETPLLRRRRSRLPDEERFRDSIWFSEPTCWKNAHSIITSNTC